MIETIEWKIEWHRTEQNRIGQNTLEKDQNTGKAEADNRTGENRIYQNEICYQSEEFKGKTIQEIITQIKARSNPQTTKPVRESSNLAWPNSSNYYGRGV